jgi:hypothetical protein
MGPSEMCRSPICPKKAAASLMRVRLMVEGVALHVEGSYQVGVSQGLRQVRPWVLNQSVRSRAQLDGGCPTRDH